MLVCSHLNCNNTVIHSFAASVDIDGRGVRSIGTAKGLNQSSYTVDMTCLALDFSLVIVVCFTSA